MKRDAHNRQPESLDDSHYDADGWPMMEISLSWHAYELALGLCSCWLAEIEDLPGYYGEGATPHEALERLRRSLGPRPHFRVARKMFPENLAASVRRTRRADKVAALTRADGYPHNLGGGSGVDASAKAEGIGKTAVNQARARLAEALQSPDGRLIGGVSKEALQLTARAAVEQETVDLWVAEQTPWRLIHAAAREAFPTKKP